MNGKQFKNLVKRKANHVVRMPPKPPARLWSLPYESSISVRPTLVGVCSDTVCHTIYDPYEGPGFRCEMEHDEVFDYYERPKVIKRRMYKCPNCDFYYFTRSIFLDHEHQFV